LFSYFFFSHIPLFVFVLTYFFSQYVPPPFVSRTLQENCLGPLPPNTLLVFFTPPAFCIFPHCLPRKTPVRNTVRFFSCETPVPMRTFLFQYFSAFTSRNFLFGTPRPFLSTPNSFFFARLQHPHQTKRPAFFIPTLQGRSSNSPFCPKKPPLSHGPIPHQPSLFFHPLDDPLVFPFFFDPVWSVFCFFFFQRFSHLPLPWDTRVLRQKVPCTVVFYPQPTQTPPPFPLSNQYPS